MLVLGGFLALAAAAAGGVFLAVSRGSGEPAAATAATHRAHHDRGISAAYRHHLHWTEFVGGDIVMTMPHAWQRLFNESGFEVVSRMEEPVPEQIVDELYRRFADFRRAYDEDGMTVEEFDSFGATVRTLRQFIGSYQDLVATVRDFMLPNPDVA